MSSHFGGDAALWRPAGYARGAVRSDQRRLSQIGERSVRYVLARADIFPTSRREVLTSNYFVTLAILPRRRLLTPRLVVHYAPCRVTFQQEDGSSVMNVISTRPDGELLLSYIFEWRHPDVSAGTEKASQLEAAHWEVGQVPMFRSIAQIS